MSTEALLEDLSFEEVRPGEYWIAPTVKFEEELKEKLDEVSSLEAEEEPSLVCLGYAVSEGLTEEVGLRDTKYLLGPAEVKRVKKITAPAAVKKRAPAKKSDNIATLEKLLSSEYDSRVKITSIKRLPITHKPVKQVFFYMDYAIHQVWIFKADPNKTARELSIYHIAYNNGVPTGKPIGYIPTGAKEKYPFDVAVIGGVVEHAGEPYNDFIRKIDISPRIIFETAESIAGMIADYHVKLTNAEDNFDSFGIELNRANPRKEINERMLAALKIDESKASNLINVCEDLYEEQNPFFCSFSWGYAYW